MFLRAGVGLTAHYRRAELGAGHGGGPDRYSPWTGLYWKIETGTQSYRLTRTALNNTGGTAATPAPQQPLEIVP